MEILRIFIGPAANRSNVIILDPFDSTLVRAGDQRCSEMSKDTIFLTPNFYSFLRSAMVVDCFPLSTSNGHQPWSFDRHTDTTISSKPCRRTFIQPLGNSFPRIHATDTAVVTTAGILRGRNENTMSLPKSRRECSRDNKNGHFSINRNEPMRRQ